ncbi:glycosyltransferase [Mycoplasmatota bacterium WC44]
MNTNKIEISVVIPLYNVEKYMEKCVDSILNQTFRRFEIILVNDGSPDSSGNIADQYAKKYDNITVIHKDNGGLSSARNAGMEVSQGNYILFIDSDDWAENTLLEKAYNKIKEDDYEVCVFNVNRINEKNDISFIQGEQLDNEISIESYGRAEYISNFILNKKSHRYSAWNRLYKLSFLRNNQLVFEPNSEIHSEDMLFNLECCLFVTKVCSINDALYYHLLRSGTISTSPKPGITYKLITLIERFIYKSKKHKKYRQIEKVIPEIIQYLFFMSMGSEINSNKKNFISVYHAVKIWYRKTFFISSMIQLSHRGYSKRNLISYLLAKKLKIISTMIIYIIIKFRNSTI